MWVLILINSNKKADDKSHQLFYGASNGTRHEPNYAELAQMCLHDEETIDNIMSKEKPNQKYHFKIQEEKLFKVIPKNINREHVEDYILKACEYYSKHIRQKERDSR